MGTRFGFQCYVGRLRSRWQLLVTLAVPMPSSQLKAGFWFLALGIRLFGQSKVPKTDRESCVVLATLFFDLNLFLASLVILPGDSCGPHHWFLLSPGIGQEISRKHEWKLTFATGVHPFCPCLALFTLLFRQKRSCFFHRRALICIWKKHVWFYHFPKRHTIFQKPIHEGKRRSSENCHCLGADWSNHFPTLGCQQEISWFFWGQTLRLWSSHHERSIGDNPTLSWSFKRMSLFVLVSLPCLFLNFTKASQMLPLRRKTYVSSLILFGPLLTVLKSVLESAHHSSIFQSVPNCVFVPNPQKKNNKNTVVSASFRPFTCFLEAFEDTNSWSTEGVALATSSQVAALSGVCGDPGIAFFLFASRTRDERLEKHWKKKTSDSQKLRWLDGFF